ncbi:RNA-binding Raly-like protein isoform X2 [Pseudoliparis swirei]|uniref:RNA-binding Raly-like protein isoform X2 n=1 Tax=Pseudoliparis swirei TaxID=2059687 RepID=UPI0024BE694E|nr:RNA-binding Raly-like protein isoform X2 [Pseudoliparis swirei]
MNHFRSDSHRDRRGGMNGELRAAHTTTAKRGNSAPDRCDYGMDYHDNRVFDYQRVPSSVPVDPGPVKRPRPSSSSSSSSSSTAAALRMKSRRASSRSINRRASSSSSSSELKMAELLSIKRELTEVKLQLDGLLACVEQMDRQRKDRTGPGPHCVPPSRFS